MGENQKEERLAAGLYIVATPIGNLEDITLRALRVLRSADFIAAEDTRRAMRLLGHFGIKKPIVSHHEHNRFESAKKIAQRIANGESCGYVTDAGMPCVSDPGAELAAKVREAGLYVSVCPGASALTAAVALCGFDVPALIFDGFPPTKNSRRKALFDSYRSQARAAVLFEAPHRIVKTLRELIASLGEDRRAELMRELTKLHETVHRGDLGELLAYFEENEPRGEFVIIIEGAGSERIAAETQKAFEDIPARDSVAGYIAEGMTKNEAIKRAAKERGLSRREVYMEMISKDLDTCN